MMITADIHTRKTTLKKNQREKKRETKSTMDQRSMKEPGLSMVIRIEEMRVETMWATIGKECLVATFFKACVDLEITVDMNTQKYANPGKN